MRGTPHNSGYNENSMEFIAVLSGTLVPTQTS